MKKRIWEEPLVRSFLERNAGRESVKVVEILLRSRKALRDEDIAKKMKVKVTEVRTMLNRLHYRGIANYEKTKDENTGWFTYTWHIDRGKLLETVTGEIIDRIKELEKEKEIQESYTIFLCKKCKIEMPFEVAAEYNFRCPECGSEMFCVDPAARKRQLSREITLLKKALERIVKLK